MATIMAVAGCAVVNLFYFIPQIPNRYRFTIPGILTIAIVLIALRANISDMLIFEFYGIINLTMGIVWAYKIKRN